MPEISPGTDPLPQDPVFVVGYPRSGTTLLQGLLATQPGFFSLPETHFFGVVQTSVRVSWRGSVKPACLDALAAALLEKMAWRMEPDERAALEALAQGWHFTTKSVFEFIVARYLMAQPAFRAHSGPFRWIEKTPVHANHLDKIAGFYPSLQAVHIVRHPVPAIFSRKRKFGFDADVPLEDLARRWVRLVGNADRFSRAHPGTVQSIRYEDFIADVDAGLRALGAFLRFAPDPSQISRIPERIAHLSLDSEPWKAADRRRPLANTNEDYRGIVDAASALEIERIAGEWMERLGYRPWAAGKE